MTSRPLTKLQAQVLALIGDARDGEISGLSIATWLLRRRHPEGITGVLRSLEKRGLISMRPMDDPADWFRRRFPDRMKARYSLKKET